MNLANLLPLAALAAIPVASLLQRALFNSYGAAFLLSAIGYLFASLGFIGYASSIPHQVTPLFMIDRLGCFYGALISGASLVICFYSYSYIKRQTNGREEYYVLLSLATLGATVLTLSAHFSTFFLGLETLTIALYALIAYKRTSIPGIEGALKYLILAGVSSAFLLFGIAMLYLSTGSLAFSQFKMLPSTPMILGALAMILVGIGFKLAIVPFYLWTPDVYQGAPAPVAAFIATVSKGAVFIFFFRFFTLTSPLLIPLLTAIAIASMVIGNLLALLQDNIKRLLAYSSIAHLGYLLVAFLSEGELAQQAIGFYLPAYFISTLGAFGVIAVLSDADEDVELLSSYRGLAWNHPMYAAILILMLFSLAGLPLTAGFIGKFFVMRAALSSHLWLPVIILIITSIIGLFYYLRVIISLFEQGEEKWHHPLSVTGTATLICLTLLLIWLGIYPESFAEFLLSIPIQLQ